MKIHSKTNAITLLKTGILGVLSTEVLYFAIEIASKLNQSNTIRDHQDKALIISLLCFFIVIAYVISRDLISIISKILRSRRLDILIIFCFGILVSISFDGIGTNYYKMIVSTFNSEQWLLFVFLPIILWVLILLRKFFSRFNDGRSNDSPFFISDVEKKTKTEDLLGFSDHAERFAERVINQESSESMVFGIDAPWGVGKSSFVNFCNEYWEKNYRPRVIVYNFNPLRYADRTNLLEKLIDGLIRVIQKHAFIPEIRPLISNYSRFIKGAKGTISFFFVNYEISPDGYTIDDAFLDLEHALLNLDKKVIIVVDDLDRLNLSDIKDVLFVIKKSFTLPNITYVLCYDTENISALEKDKPDLEKVTEFLEKFINVKVSLYLDSSVLSNFVSENLAKALVGNSQADPILISKAMGGLKDIFTSQDYYQYIPFVGDIRKLKRLINTLLLLEIEKTDFENSDFTPHDLIHLLLIYINYPNVFRKIYNTETNGKRGFFSLVSPYDDNYPGKAGPLNLQGERSYKNSTEYTTYIEGLSTNLAFLLNKVFDVSRRLDSAEMENVPQEIKSSYACFNGIGMLAGGRNLEQYLNLIVKQSKPQKSGQHKFYLNCKNDILQGKSVKDVLSDSEFSYSKNEESHEQFWRVVINSLSEFDSHIASTLITYLVDNIPNYSLFADKNIGVGLRDHLTIYLTNILDQAGWRDKSGKHYENTDENVSEIAEWVFGEGRHVGRSILETLAKEDRGILGLYDLLAFRLFCSADRGGDIYNLQRALSKHGDPAAPTSGAVMDIAIAEMREISQNTFQIFERQYINEQKNIFDIIDQLTLKDLTGRYYDFVDDKIKKGDVKYVEFTVEELKSRLKSFIIYQLGNSIISSGVGCGYYDPTGKEDKNGIRVKVNDYLFNQCFDPSINCKNYEHFVDYLLINFTRYIALGGEHLFMPNINELTKVLDRERLVDYWNKHSTSIKALKLTASNKEVVTANYTASYKDDLLKVYEILDKLVQESAQQTDS